jgi:5'-3' exonuclease
MNDSTNLIIDSANLFLRSWSAFPSMDANGEPMGGFIGYVKTLQKLIREIKPKQVFIAWEGGGSSKRRSIFSEYKMNRKPEKLNRYYEGDIPSTDDNRQRQTVILIQFLKNLPVHQLYASECEADDVISYLCKYALRGQKNIIASSDKDFYQLVDENTLIYSFHKKKYVSEQNIFDEFRITPQNFALAKCLCGDPSDNIPGVKGFGFKTVSKLFPILSSQESVLVEDLLNYCHTHISDSKLYKRVIDEAELVKQNWRLVFLDGSMLTQQTRLKIDYTCGTNKPHIDKITLYRLLHDEHISDLDVESVCYDLQYLARQELND